MARYSFLQFLRDQWAVLPDPDALKADLTGKTVVVLGSNVGLGFEAAKHFARMNPQKLILAVRNEEKGKKALQAIQKETWFAGGEVWRVDLDDFSSVSQFADRFEGEGGGRLDILVENAGVLLFKHYQTKDGWERSSVYPVRTATYYPQRADGLLRLANQSSWTTLLGILLLPLLSRTKPDGPSPRLVVVTSEIHLLAEFSPEELKAPNILERLNDEKHSDMYHRYHITKLFNIFYVRSLASRLSPDNPLVVTSVNPGYCQSNQDHNMIQIFTWISSFFRRVLGRTTEVGSRTLVHAALGNPGKRDFHGAYLNKCEIGEESDFVLSQKGKEVQDKIWDETVDVLKKVGPRVEGIVNQYLRFGL